MKQPIFIILFLIFIFLAPVKSASAESLLIVEVQIAGEEISYDLIKIYNPNNSDIYLGNFNESYVRIVKRSKTSAKDYTIKSWSKEPEAKISAKGYYLWASNKEGYDLMVGANTSTSQNPKNLLLF